MAVWKTLFRGGDDDEEKQALAPSRHANTAQQQQTTAKTRFSSRRPRLSRALTVVLWLAALGAIGLLLLEGRSFLAHRGRQEVPSLRSDVRWGIAGLGRIGHDFAATLTTRGGHLEAVAAGSLPDRAVRSLKFASTFGVRSAYDSYEALARDPKVDVVYVATTNDKHFDMTMLFLDHGKHVLVEKPTATSAEDVLAMLRKAREKKRLLVTNFWNAAVPTVKWAKAQLPRIGEAHTVRGDMAFQAIEDPRDRFYNKTLGGGATMDMGCYLVQTQLSYLVKNASLFDSQITSGSLVASLEDLGVHVHAYGDLAATGVDMEVAAVVELRQQQQPRGGVSTTTTLTTTSSPQQQQQQPQRGIFGVSLQRDSPFNFETLGSHGSLSLAAPANCPASATLQVLRDANVPKHHPVAPCCGQPLTEKTTLTADLPKFPSKKFAPQYPGTIGFAFMIDEVQQCLSKKNKKKDTPSCIADFPSVPAWIQLATQQIVDDIIDQVHHPQQRRRR
eukprot:CAMPEP_0118917594 /NCGR_PEP_ID=MMETSP1166-20130328/17416_1 /TAXON_ID=1104430 /ORGANISM="Chrysoreinhardia sp, Strain CCMP3193" /LENGTH=501 /DNA_ID=CAMNT_0006857787 /DNA_START=96 /DNA_END=1601 /DNA_ORIENTATION=+